MKSLGFLLVLSTITAAAYSLICRTYWKYESRPCGNPFVRCSPDEVCTYYVTLVTRFNTTISQYAMLCGKRTNCNLKGTISFINGKIEIRTSCCDTTGCIAPYPRSREESTEKNGLTCSTCSSDIRDYCYTPDTMTCTGEETKCGLMSRKVNGTINLNDVFRGCATKSFCDILGNRKSSFADQFVELKMYCSDGAIGLHEGLLVSALAFLLAKLLI